MHNSTLLKHHILRRSVLFARLSDKEIDAILACAQVAKYTAGAQIFMKGDPGNSMMAVLHGRISISAPSPDGRQVVLSVLHGGDIFGEIALLDGKERTADVNALTDCEILIVSRRSFWPVLKRRPDVCIDLTLVLCERLRHTNQIVADLAFLDLESRIAKVLLRLAEGSGAGKVQAKPVALRISQHELGELVSGSRERVNKHLHAWKRSGIVTIKRGAIVILDMAALAGRWRLPSAAA